MKISREYSCTYLVSDKTVTCSAMAKGLSVLTGYVKTCPVLTGYKGYISLNRIEKPY